MARTYNPPPEWPAAPAGWSPGPGWRPDPSWPAAPDGWQLWVEDDHTRGHASGRRRSALLVAAGLVAGLVLGAAVANGGAADERATVAAEQERLTDLDATLVTRGAELDGQADELLARETAVTAAEGAQETTAAEQTTRADELTALQVQLDGTAAELAAREAAVAAREAAAASVPAASTTTATGGSSSGAAPVHYANCDAARAAGAAPVRVGDPGYRSALDRDGDGVGCE